MFFITLNDIGIKVLNVCYVNVVESVSEYQCRGRNIVNMYIQNRI